jgi:hypothetical protein
MGKSMFPVLEEKEKERGRTSLWELFDDLGRFSLWEGSECRGAYAALTSNG